MSANLSEKSDQSNKDGHLNATGGQPAKKQEKKHNHLLIGAVVLLILALVFYLSTRPPAQDPNVLEITGRIEAPETYITAGVGTTVKSVLVQEGDTVTAGQPLLQLDSKILKVKMQATGSEESLAKQAQSQASTQVSAAQDDVDKAKKKSKGFFAKIFGSKKKKEEEKQRLTQEMKSAQTQLFQAKAAVIKAQAAKGEVSSKIPFFQITSPIDGIVVTRSVEPGEVVAPGQVMLAIIDPHSVYMKGFVPEGNLSQIKIGQAADVILDTPKSGGDDKDGHKADGHMQKAKITSIDTTPSFTPQNIYFKDDRIKQVFGIKMTIIDPDGSAKPGMPADAKISLQNNSEGRVEK